jgi:diphosphomevalonate decarboxylase
MKNPSEKILLSSSWKSPSNIALVKYWGKKDKQIPRNSSLSFSLSESVTTTKVDVMETLRAETSHFEFYFEGKRQPSFEPKILAFFERVANFIPNSLKYKLIIHSENTFPHSSGIASSASAMSALSLSMLDLEQQLSGKKMSEEEFNKSASVMSRLGSGSASRSVFGGYALWGYNREVPGSSDEFAINVNQNIHEIFRELHDSILIVEAGSKAVSSTKGHSLMDSNPYAGIRYSLANQNTAQLLKLLQSGDMDAFISIVEAEAMTLHALMMASSPWFLLMQPNTIQLISKIVTFRKQSAVPLCFTLDAGPNIHLIYPSTVRNKVLEFIETDLLGFCSNGQWIDDKIGSGPEKLNIPE